MAGTIRLRDVATRANVATSTVSRVFSGYPYVSEATREAVLRAAREMGLDNSVRIGHVEAHHTVILTDLCREINGSIHQDDRVAGSEFAHQVLAGAQAAMRQCDRAAELHLVSGDTIAANLRHFSMTKRRSSDVRCKQGRDDILGYILIGGHIEQDLVQELQRMHIRCVIVGARPDGVAVDCVMADYVGAVGQAVHHLAQAGRRTIGLVKGSPRTITSREKYKGFRFALCEHDLPFSSTLVAESESFAPEAAAVPTEKLLTDVPALDAIIYGDDYLAMGGLHTLKRMGRRVPDDIAVIGCHNYRIAAFTDPPLTTVHISGDRMGAMAARRLCMMGTCPDQEPWLVVAPTYLVVRASA